MSTWEPVAYLAALRAELELVDTALADVDWGAPVAACPGWDVAQVVRHLGGVQRMVVQAIEAGTPSHSSRHAPPDGTDLREWLRAGGDRLLAALDGDPDAPAWSFDPRGGTLGWWRRRQAQEHLVHRVDVEHALGGLSPIRPGLAADGVGEVVDVMIRLQRTWADLEVPHPISLAATDTGDTWRLGPAGGEPVGTATGTAADLLLALWKRADLDTIELAGDTGAVRRVLELALTP